MSRASLTRPRREAVVQNSPEHGAQLVGDVWKRQPGSRIFGTNPGLQIKHTGNTETNPRLLFGRKRLPQRRVCELFAYGPLSVGKQREHPACRESATKRVAERYK